MKAAVTIKFEKYWMCGRQYVCPHKTKLRAWIHTLLWPFHPPSQRVRMSAERIYGIIPPNAPVIPSPKNNS